MPVPISATGAAGAAWAVPDASQQAYRCNSMRQSRAHPRRLPRLPDCFAVVRAIEAAVSVWGASAPGYHVTSAGAGRGHAD
jgi:hypothetical protein